MNNKDFPIGIDLGTTNSCVGVFRNGSIEIIPNQFEGKLVPSVVSFCDNQITVGDQTLNQVYNDPEKVIYSIKRIIGKKSTEKDYKDLINSLTYKNKISVDENFKPYINVKFNKENRKYYPEEISAIILKRIKENDEKFLGQEIKKVVITIPAYFTEAQREATEEAGKLAGLQILKIINEPTAAALAYGLKDKDDLKKSEEDDYISFTQNETKNIKDEKKEKKNILVFDLGGGTFDITCLKLINDEEEGLQFVIRSHSGYTLLGGDDFDNLLVDYCIENFENMYTKKIKIRNLKLIKIVKKVYLQYNG